MRGKPEDDIFERQAALRAQGRTKTFRSSSRYDQIDTAPEYKSREIGLMAGAQQQNFGSFYIHNEDLSPEVTTYSLTDANQMIK